MKKMLLISKNILKPTILILLTIYGAQVVLGLILFSFSLNETKDLTRIVQFNFILYTGILVIIYIFDFLCNKVNMLLTMGYDRKFLANMYSITHLGLILVFIIITLLNLYITPIMGDFTIESLTHRNSLIPILHFSYCFIAFIFFGANYLGFIATTFMNLPLYKSLLINGVIWSLGFIALVKYLFPILDFLANYYLIAATVGIIIGVVLEIFVYKQILNYEVKK